MGGPPRAVFESIPNRANASSALPTVSLVSVEERMQSTEIPRGLYPIYDELRHVMALREAGIYVGNHWNEYAMRLCKAQLAECQARLQPPEPPEPQPEPPEPQDNRVASCSLGCVLQ